MEEQPKRKPASKCIHDKRKSRCKDCGGSELCIHGRRKTRCKECEGGEYCEHSKIRIYCKECGGSQICNHGISKYYCLDCNGKGRCEHNKIKSQCKECKGTKICEHDLYKPYCKECGGSQICKHDKQKQTCKECEGSDLCKSSWCEVRKRKDLEDYCFFCYVNIYPEKEISKNYRTKEKEVVNYVLKEFPDFDWLNNKTVPDGCSRKRPDLFCDFGYQVLTIEINENQHEYYDCSCENFRLMQIFKDIDERPLINIQFNPDAYLKNKDEKIKSCWKIGKNGKLSISNHEDWNQRLEKLKEHINHWIENKTEKSIEVVRLFYDS